MEYHWRNDVGVNENGSAGEQPDQESVRIAADQADEQGLLFTDDVSPLPSDTGYRGPTACAAAGITYRQLDYWARTDLVRPSLVDAKGSGSRRLYSYSDLLELKLIKSLLDAGIKLESVRNAFDYMREHVGSDIVSAHLVIQGEAVVLCDGEQLVDVLRQGQGVLNVLPLGPVKHELDSQLVELESAGNGKPTSATRAG
jgi:DNA-binding transcriptional MerR regulator